MLFNTLKKFKYTYSADYYGYITKTGQDGTTTEKAYDLVATPINLALSTSFIGDIIILTDAKLQNAGVIRNIKDRNDNQVYVDGVWEIKSTQPIVNAVGIIDGYKYKAKIISGDV